MTPGLDIDAQLIGIFLVGCRIGACLMVLPGISSSRVPVRVRLLLTVVMAFALGPTITAGATPVQHAAGAHLAMLVMSEIGIGFVLGLVSRIYIAALEFMGALLANSIGLAGLDPGIDTDEAAPSLSTLLTVVVTLVLLILDMHHVVIATVFDTYSYMPISAAADAGAALRLVAAAMQAAFVLGLQIVGPFVVYGLLVNMIFGIVGKLIPQVPSYFVSIPFLIMGGFFTLYFLVGEMVRMMAQGTMSGLMRL